MDKYSEHTIYLQDGTLFSFKKRFKKHKSSLLRAFSQVKDGRDKYGKRHSLPLILIILFGGIIAGCTTIKDCRLWAIHNKKWIKLFVLLPHGIPDERTLSRSIQKIDMDSLVCAFLTWRRILYGQEVGTVASFDGKTMRGVHGKKAVRHMLSLFTHGLHQILGQIGVTQKENEIPAVKRLLEQTTVKGMLLLGDALHTQKETIRDILSKKADYLLFAKDNQKGLVAHLQMFFSDIPFKSVTEQASYTDNTHSRDVTTTVTASHDEAICSYLKDEGWDGVRTVGKIQRTGTRKSSDGKLTHVDETVYCISSRVLTAAEVAKHARNHWQIENNLHWQKDVTFLEDRQTLRSGNAPQVMTFLRSMCLSLFNLWEFASVTETIHNFQMSRSLHHRFLNLAAVV